MIFACPIWSPYSFVRLAVTVARMSGPTLGKKQKPARVGLCTGGNLSKVHKSFSGKGKLALERMQSRPSRIPATRPRRRLPDRKCCVATALHIKVFGAIL
jgi:hypothetical protein